MVESVNNRQNNAVPYTVGGAVTGAVAGGAIGKWGTKPHFKDDKLTDEFVRTVDKVEVDSAKTANKTTVEELTETAKKSFVEPEIDEKGVAKTLTEEQNKANKAIGDAREKLGLGRAEADATKIDEAATKHLGDLDAKSAKDSIAQQIDAKKVLSGIKDDAAEVDVKKAITDNKSVFGLADDAVEADIDKVVKSFETKELRTAAIEKADEAIEAKKGKFADLFDSKKLKATTDDMADNTKKLVETAKKAIGEMTTGSAKKFAMYGAAALAAVGLIAGIATSKKDA